MKKLQNKIALVTGASKGIGAAIARQLARDGATVIVNYAHSREDADRVVSQIVQTGAKACAVQADVSNKAEVKTLFKTIAGKFGHIDILVNNAGVYATSALADITEHEFHRQFDLNVLGLIQCTQAAVEVFNPAGGSIINISSSVTSFTPANSAVYTASKGAVDAITRTLANELGPKKIRVNSVNRGWWRLRACTRADFLKTPFARKSRPLRPWAASVSLRISPRRWPFWRREMRAGSPVRYS